MRTPKFASRAALVVAAGATMGIGVLGIASAHSLSTGTSLYNGSEAFSYHSDSCNSSYVHPRAAVKDARSDGYNVRVEYYRQSNSPNNMMTLWNRGGSGTTEFSGCSGDPVSRLRGCTERPVIFDVCADWRE